MREGFKRLDIHIKPDFYKFELLFLKKNRENIKLRQQ